MLVRFRHHSPCKSGACGALWSLSLHQGAFWSLLPHQGAMQFVTNARRMEFKHWSRCSGAAPWRFNAIINKFGGARLLEDNLKSLSCCPWTSCICANIYLHVTPMTDQVVSAFLSMTLSHLLLWVVIQLSSNNLP